MTVLNIIMAYQKPNGDVLHSQQTMLIHPNNCFESKCSFGLLEDFEFKFETLEGLLQFIVILIKPATMVSKVTYKLQFVSQSPEVTTVWDQYHKNAWGNRNHDFR